MDSSVVRLSPSYEAALVEMAERMDWTQRHEALYRLFDEAKEEGLVSTFAVHNHAQDCHADTVSIHATKELMLRLSREGYGDVSHNATSVVYMVVKRGDTTVFVTPDQRLPDVREWLASQHDWNKRGIQRSFENMERIYGDEAREHYLKDGAA